MTQYFKPHILIVDDDSDTLKLIENVLLRSGYDVSTALNWAEVEEHLITMEKIRQRYHVLVVDVMIPEMSGFNIVEKLRDKLKPMPHVIFLSARSTMEDMVKASDLGAAKYLKKPTTPEKLLEAIQDVLSLPI
jgi:DNA-binding response OmpR family regulator